MKLAIITGADGGMGTEITRAVAKAGYKIIMACYRPEKAEKVREMLVRDTGNPHLEVLGVDLSSLASVASFAETVLKRGDAVSLLMNNAGTMETCRRITEDGLERTVSVNYVAPYLLTRKLLPLMGEGSRIVNMVSCTYAVGCLDFPDFFLRGRKGGFWRIPVYSNTKLALTLFTLNLAARLKEKGIVMIEQPMPKEQLDDIAWVTQQSPLPVFADESLQRLGDVAALKGAFTGINIKLMKCTGMREAWKMVTLAHALGMRVMVGCMTETSCAISAASQFSPAVDFADLDGNLLISNDRFKGVEVVNGKITLNDLPGIGVMKI